MADDEATLRVLLGLGASAKQWTSRYDGTALIAAAHLGHDGVVRQLIARRRAAGPRQQPALDGGHRGDRAGQRRTRHQRTLSALIQAGADLQLTDRQGNTPLQLARARGYAPMVLMLEQAGARR